MVPITATFPLFKLPYLAWRNVLETMDPIDLLSTSLCSKRARIFIRSLFHRVPKTLTISVGYKVYRVELRTGLLLEMDLALEGPCKLQNWDSPDWEAKDWINYLLEVFNCEGVHLCFDVDFWELSYPDDFEFEALQKVSTGLKIIGLIMMGDDFENDFLLKVLNSFPPSDSLDLRQRPNPFPSDLITRTYDKLALDFPLSVEEVFSLNSRKIKLGSMSDHDFNALMKGWIDGWNPEMTNLSMIVKTGSREFKSVVFDGLDCHPKACFEPFKKGEVKNRFGKKASIFFDTNPSEFEGLFDPFIFIDFG